jgi:hypothetical protein
MAKLGSEKSRARFFGGEKSAAGNISGDQAAAVAWSPALRDSVKIMAASA